MKYDLKIREHNVQAHVDIESDIQEKKTGQMTFTLRLNGGNIVDYSLVEYVNVRKKYAANKYCPPDTVAI